jgi:adenylate kinase
MAKYIVLLGPPGVGKGTQAKILAEMIGLVQVSSGDLFRENFKNETELGKLAKSYMDRGELVPDDVTIAMVRERLARPDCEAGAILDGFQRTPAQAEALETMLAGLNGRVDVVPYILAEESVLVERISGWTCRASRTFVAKFSPPGWEMRLINRSLPAMTTRRRRLNRIHNTDPAAPLGIVPQKSKLV